MGPLVLWIELQCFLERCDSGVSLSESERQTIIDWVAAGAPYERHWAFEPLRRPAVPFVSE